MKNEKKYIQRCGCLAGTCILWVVLWGCSGDEGGRLPLGEREVVLRSYSEKLSGEGGLADSVFFAKGSAPGRYTEIWKAHVAPGGGTKLAEPKYYPSDNSAVYLRGFAPEGEAAGDGRIAWSLDGEKDLLVSDEQSGRLTDMFWQEGKSFRFVHLLSQLRFQLRCDEAGLEKGWKLSGLVAEGTQCEAVLSLPDKALSFSGEPKALPVFSPDSGSEPLALDTAWTAVAETVLVQPGVAVSLTVVLADRAGSLTRFEDLPVSFHETDGYPASGTSYLLSVTLLGEGTCSLSAQVAEWKRGNNGTGIIGTGEAIFN